ncbi:uncharacterized protein LOC119569279, partial [Penaeus monodon]|uniref:uncharacterized protein LOC119569279 n=1 Tax=Penaeus monodon TaxID=6687 RepID=UPI0018A714C5
NRVLTIVVLSLGVPLAAAGGFGGGGGHGGGFGGGHGGGFSGGKRRWIWAVVGFGGSGGYGGRGFGGGQGGFGGDLAAVMEDSEAVMEDSEAVMEDSGGFWKLELRAEKIKSSCKFKKFTQNVYCFLKNKNFTPFVINGLLNRFTLNSPFGKIGQCREFVMRSKSTKAAHKISYKHLDFKGAANECPNLGLSADVKPIEKLCSFLVKKISKRKFGKEQDEETHIQVCTEICKIYGISGEKPRGIRGENLNAFTIIRISIFTVVVLPGGRRAPAGGFGVDTEGILGWTGGGFGGGHGGGFGGGHGGGFG